MRLIVTLFLSALFLTLPNCCQADEGDPVAIIRLPGGGVAIETMWNLSVVITASPQDLTSKIPGVDIVPSALATTHKLAPGRYVADAAVESTDHILDRPANQTTVTWKPTSEDDKPSSNAIRIRQFQGSTLINVDGTRILHMTSPAEANLTKQQLAMVQGCDVLIADGPAVQDISPKRLVVPTKPDLNSAKVVDGNTIALSSAHAPSAVQVLVLMSDPISLTDEVTALIDRKETACEASQQVFAKLSVPQLNFRPSNGSHTPRWNAEHMMGRELLFFSQIFHAQDDAIPVADLNPKQMPPDYQAKHLDWTGDEEAMQMERVSAFTRRFAYLLRDLPLDRKAPGSGWTPKALLRQMERHYDEHTANVKKKFELPDWPK